MVGTLKTPKLPKLDMNIKISMVFLFSRVIYMTHVPLEILCRIPLKNYLVRLLNNFSVGVSPSWDGGDQAGCTLFAIIKLKNKNKSMIVKVKI